MYWGPIFLLRNPLSPLGQQSWTKSVVENFALSYPQNAYPAIMVPLWPLHSPHPGQICLVGIRNDPAGLLCLFFGGEEGGGVGRGSICSYQCFQELYLETRHGKVHFSQHFCLRLNVMYSHCTKRSINRLSQNCWDT